MASHNGCILALALVWLMSLTSSQTLAGAEAKCGDGLAGAQCSGDHTEGLVDSDGALSLLQREAEQVMSFSQILAQSSGQTHGSISRLLELTAGKMSSEAMLQEMRSLATASAKGTLQADPISSQALSTIIQQMEQNVINVSLRLHGEDQNEVNRSWTWIANCTGVMQGHFNQAASGVDALKGTMLSRNTTHLSCRSTQKTLNETMQAKKSDFYSFAQGLIPPSCACDTLPSGPSPDMLQCIQDTKSFGITNNATYLDKNVSYWTALQNLNGKKTTCDGDQGTFESAFCSYGLKLITTCDDYASCRSDHIAAYNTVISDVKSSEKARKAEYVAAKKIICYCNVLSASQADKATKLNSCNSEEHSTAPLDIIYPSGPPPEEICDKTFAAVHPCETSFLNLNYLSKDWSTLAPVAPCNPCAWSY